jgi:hypothetical protein
LSLFLEMKSLNNKKFPECLDLNDGTWDVAIHKKSK